MASIEAPPRLSVASEQESDAVSLRVGGELDLATCPVLSEEVESVFVGDPATILVDLCDVTFIDSRGIAVLLATLTRCEAEGRELRVTTASNQVRRVLELTGVAERLGGVPALV